MIEEAGIGLVPGVGFLQEGYVRITYACSMEQIVEGMNRMERSWVLTGDDVIPAPAFARVNFRGNPGKNKGMLRGDNPQKIKPGMVMDRTKVVIMGAAGRDFHNFQVCFRDDPSVEVVAFTAAQIPGIENRTFPPELAGPLYPQGIPIFPEEKISEIIRQHRIQQVIFSYSDVAHIEVMHRASLVLSLGADFLLLGPDRTMLPAAVPVISVCAVRTGSGKSGVTERIWEILKGKGICAVVIRHPMPYCDLNRMRVERFATMEDLDRYACTVEEREEYEHLVLKGITVYAGVDYEAILRSAEKEARVILWDGGNNDFSFIRPDLEIVVLDPHRQGHERLYHPGEVNFLRGQVLIINKADTASKDALDMLLASVAEFNPRAVVLQTASRISVEGGRKSRGRGSWSLKMARRLLMGEWPTVRAHWLPANTVQQK